MKTNLSPMRISARKVIWGVLLVPVLATAQASAPGKTTARPSVIPQPSPTPAPTPAIPQTALGAAPALSGPRYSPAQMDFGMVDYKGSSLRTFSITAPTAGTITLQMPKGAFLATELRRVPSAARSTSNQALGHTATKPTPVQVNNVLVYQWNLAPGEELQLDIVFTPGNLSDTNPGPRTGSLDFTGPGTQPWHVNVALHGAVAGLLAQPNPQPAPNAQPKKPASAGPSSATQGTASALPMPTPGPAGAALALNTPTHSPDSFNFGEVWDGDMIRKTLHLTTTAAGYVTVQIPKGPFRVAEFREMGAVQLPSKNNPGNKSTQNLGPIQPVKTKITYQDGQSGPFQWSLAPDTDIQIDIAFQPHFQFGSEMAGQKSAAMKVTGPGRHGNWTISVPLVGMFDGLKISATMAPETKEILAIAGEKYVPVNVTLYGLDTPVTGTIRAGSQVPQGVSVMGKSVKLGAKENVSVTVWLSLGNISVSKGSSQPLELVFDDGQKTSKALFQFTGLPNSLNLSSGQHDDCNVSHLNLKLSLKPPMHSKITGGVYISNLDKTTDPSAATYDLQMSMPKYFTNEGYLVGTFMVYAESGGLSVLQEGLWPTYETQNSSDIKKTGPITISNAKQWAQILDGHARFGCQLSRYYNHDPQKIPEVLCESNYECTKIKWEPMQ